MSYSYVDSDGYRSAGVENFDSEVEGENNPSQTDERRQRHEEAQDSIQQSRVTFKKGRVANNAQAAHIPRSKFDVRTQTVDEWMANKHCRDSREDTRRDTREDARRDSRDDSRRDTREDTRRDARRVTREDSHREAHDEYRDGRAGAFSNSLNTSHYKEMYQPNGQRTQEGSRSARPDGRQWPFMDWQDDDSRRTQSPTPRNTPQSSMFSNE